MHNQVTTPCISQPTLPKDLILDIISRCDPATIGRCRMLSHEWKEELTGEAFLWRQYVTCSTREKSILIQVFFPHWTAQNIRIIRLTPTTGNILSIPLLPYQPNYGNFDIIGEHNGSICAKYSTLEQKVVLVVWNMLSRSMKQIPQLKQFTHHMAINVFAFAYLPNSIHYVVCHAFKKNLPNKFLYYRIYSSAEAKWTSTFALGGDIGKIGPRYVVLHGDIFWINFTGDEFQVAENILILSLKTQQFQILPIRERYRSDFQSLMIFDNHVCFASHPREEDNYTISLWAINKTKENSYTWTSLFKLGGLRVYDNPLLFVSKDLITLADDSIHTGRPINELIMSSFREEVQYERRILKYKIWGQEVELKFITEYCYGLFPV